MGINRESITGGGRSRKISRARAVLAYIWVRYLGRSGNDLAKALGVSPQSHIPEFHAVFTHYTL